MEKKPYEISIWSDYLDEGTSSYYDEKKIAIIGSDTMAVNSRAISPKFTKKITGEYTLEFTLYTQYFDEETNSYQDNPYIGLLNNEVKIKLNYDDEWYDFIIKQIQESSDQKSYYYVAEALFINELAKNGFSLVFDPELENSTGTIQELVSAALEGTDWEVDDDSSERIQQTKEEPLYKLTTKKAITAKYRVISDDTITETSITIPASKEIYVFYSVVVNQESFFQFLYREDGQYELDDDNVITNSECYFIEDFSFSAFSEYFTESLDALWISTYRGDRLVQSSVTYYDSRLDKFVNVYLKNNETYYGYTTTEYKTGDYVKNIVTNPSDFTDKTGWEVNNNQTIDMTVYPPVLDDEGKPNTGCAQYLIVNPTASSDYLYNTGFNDNRKNYIPSDENSGGIAKDSEWVLRYSIFEDDDEKPGTAATASIFVSIYTIENTSITLGDRILNFDTTLNKYYRANVNSTNYKSNTYYIYNSESTEEDKFELCTSETYDSSKRYYSYGTFYKGSVLNALSYTDLLNKKVGIFVKLTSGETYWIKNVDIFPYSTNDEGDITTPDPIAIDGYYITHYFYYSKTENESATKAEDIITYETTESDPSYVLQYDKTYTKKRSYEASESNRLNIIEELCELFECWAEFKINHDNKGRILPIETKTYYEIEIKSATEWRKERQAHGNKLYYYDSELETYVESVSYKKGTQYYYAISTYNYDKKVIIKNFIGKENFTGFKYGINLKSVRRDLDSAEIVSKIIVKDNSNDYATDGYCSISRATENPCGENFLYDFRHYYNTGLLNYAQVVNDLYTYTSSTPWLGYYKRMKEANKEREDIIAQIAILANQITNLEASIQSYEALKDESAKEYNESKYYVDSFNPPFTYEHYIGENTEYDSGTSKGELYDAASDPLKHLIDTSPVSELPTAASSSIGDTAILQGSTLTQWECIASSSSTSTDGKEWVRLSSIALKKYCEELESLKETSSLVKYLTATTSSKTWTEKYTDLYQQYYIALNGQGSVGDDNYIQGLQPQYDALQLELTEIKATKETLNAQFYAKYSRFIQEGSWTDDSYMDDNLYYYDAEATLATSAQPQVTYTISVLELSQLEDYEGYSFDVGDKTTIEDIEFFGWDTKKATKTPYKEEVIISEVTWNLDSPENNTIKVQNYKTRFEDLFQRITASTTALEFASGSYNTAASAVTTTGAITGTSLQSAFNQNAITVSNIHDQTVIWDDTGITISNLYDPNQLLRLYNGGILIYDGDSWNVGISGSGINANYLVAGQIDVSKVRIMNGEWITYKWDTNGLTAYAFSQENGTIKSLNTNKFVRFDQFGLYGINTASEFIPTSVNEVIENAVYGLTWGGFFFKSLHADTGYEGMVKISDTDDLVVRVTNLSTDTYVDRIKIGAINRKNDKYVYGMMLRNDSGEQTLYTSDDGNLWLSNKITIAENTEVTPLVKLGYLDETRAWLGVTSHEVFHAGSASSPTFTEPVKQASNKGFIVYEDGTFYAAGAYIDGTIHANSGTIGGLSIEEIGNGYSLMITPLNGSTIKDKAQSALKCTVLLNGSEFAPGTGQTLEYQWYRGSDEGLIELSSEAYKTLGSQTSEFQIPTSEWTSYGTDNILYYTCIVTLTTT